MNKVFKHPLSDVQSKQIGSGSRIWQYVVVLSGAKIGENCNICSHCFIENDVFIGDNVTIKNGVYIFDGTVIENNVFIGHNVSFTNDKYPRSKAKLVHYPKITIKRGATVGAGSILLPGVSVGENAMVGAGTLVSADVPANTLLLNDRRVLKSSINT